MREEFFARVFILLRDEDLMIPKFALFLRNILQI
jgi:hypothetical protein